MWLGKVIGALLGFAVANVFGLVVGAFIGHMFDKSLGQFKPVLSAQEREQAEHLFFETVFQLMGYVAKADGRISEEEVAQAEQHMAQMRLSGEQRQQAIAHFKAGAEPDFDLVALGGRFNEVANRLPKLKQTLLTYVINMALADGRLDPAEEACLSQIAAQMGFSGFAFNHLMAMLRAQAGFQQSHGAGGAFGQGHAGGQQSYRPPSAADELAMAYEALGVDEQVSDAVLKKTYRKLISENHPDKLMGQGVPQEMIDVATERSKTIQTAYDLIKKHRKAVNG
ncbi:co-chaperone DjlA [Halioxenophilus aromaticivorans]